MHTRYISPYTRSIKQSRYTKKRTHMEPTQKTSVHENTAFLVDLSDQITRQKLKYQATRKQKST